MSDDLSTELEMLERERLRLLVAADVDGAAALHADDFRLITPRGNELTKADYMASIADREIDYTRWEPGPIAVRPYGDGAVLRYRAEMEMGGVVRQLWHTDVYERRSAGWQVVWSHATWIAD